MSLISCIATVAAAIAAICSFYSARQANLISERQLQAQQSEHQPIFRVKSLFLKDEGSSVYNNEIITISYDGQSPKEIDSVKVNTYFEIDRNHKAKSDTLYVPIPNYFTAANSDYNGQPVYTTFGPDNNKIYGQLNNECIGRSKDGTYYFIKKRFLIKIAYMDIDGASHSVYFINRRLCEKTEYDRIKSESEAVFSYNLFNLESLHLDNVIKYFPQQ